MLKIILSKDQQRFWDKMGNICTPEVRQAEESDHGMEAPMKPGKRRKHVEEVAVWLRTVSLSL